MRTIVLLKNGNYLIRFILFSKFLSTKYSDFVFYVNYKHKKDLLPNNKSF